LLTPRGTHRPSSADDLYYHTLVFMYYLRTIDSCLREWAHVVIADLGASFQHLWELFDALDILQVECDESKRVIFTIWARALAVHPELVSFFTETARFKRLLDVRLAQRPTAQYHEYNNEALPGLFAVINYAVNKRPELVPTLAAHGSFSWAIRSLLVECAESSHALQLQLLDLARTCAAAVPAFRSSLASLVLESARLHMGADGAHAPSLKLLTFSATELEEHVHLLEHSGLAQLVGCIQRTASAFLNGSQGAVPLLLQLMPLLTNALRVLTRHMAERRDYSAAVDRFDPAGLATAVVTLFTKEDPTNGHMHRTAATLALAATAIQPEGARRVLTLMLLQRERGLFFTAAASRPGTSVTPLMSHAAHSASLMRWLPTHHAPADAQQLLRERTELYTTVYELELQVCFLSAQMAQTAGSAQLMSVVTRYLTLLIAETSAYEPFHERLCVVLRQLRQAQPSLIAGTLQEPSHAELLVLAVLHAISINPSCAALEECAALYREVLASISSESAILNQRRAEVTGAVAQLVRASATPEPALVRALNILTRPDEPQGGMPDAQLSMGAPSTDGVQAAPPSTAAEARPSDDHAAPAAVHAADGAAPVEGTGARTAGVEPVSSLGE